MPKVNFLSTFFDAIVGADTDGDGGGDGDAAAMKQQHLLQGGSLAELWVSFLEAEAGTGASAGAAQGTTPNISGPRAEATPISHPTPTSANIKSPPAKLSGRPVPSIGAI